MAALNCITKAVGFIAGGASGLGAATAKRLLKNGAKVAVFDLEESTENFEKMCSELSSSETDNCMFLPGDVTDDQSIKKAVMGAMEKFGYINLNVNCAGVGYAQRIYSERSKMTHSLSEFERVLNVNLGGTFQVMTRCVEAMAATPLSQDPFSSERGVIINTSSIAAFEGQVGQLAYAASKGAIASMTLPAARDLSDMNIRVMTIAPGIIETPLLRGLPEKAVTELISNTVYPRRLGDPEEFAHLVQSIYENTLLNGEIIRLDGAMRMQP